MTTLPQIQEVGGAPVGIPRWAWSVLLLLFIFGTPLRGLPSVLNLPVLIGLAALAGLALAGRTRLHLDFFLYATPMVIGIVYGCLLAAVTGNDLLFEKDLLRNVFYATVAACVCPLLAAGGFRAIDLLSLISRFMVVNAFVVMLCFLTPGLQESINSYLLLSANENSNLARAFTYSGLLPARGASGSLLASIYFLYLPFAWGRTRWGDLRLVLGAVVVTASIFFIGRSGLISAAIWLIFGAVATRKLRLLVPLAAGTGILVGLSYLTWIGAFPNNAGIVLSFALEPIIVVLFEGGGITGTNETLFRMLYLPDDAGTLLFGIGTMLEYDAPLGFLKSDSGYVRWVYEQGLVAVMLGMAYWFFLASRIRKRPLRVLYLLVISCILAMTVKEPFVFKPAFAQFVTLIFFLAAAEDNAAVPSQEGRRA